MEYVCLLLHLQTLVGIQVSSNNMCQAQKNTTRLKTNHFILYPDGRGPENFSNKYNLDVQKLTAKTTILYHTKECFKVDMNSESFAYS